MKKYLIDIFEKASGKLTYLKETDLIFTVPNQKGHGDYATNIAMILAKKLKKNPRELAVEIVNGLEYDKNVIEKIEIAGPGFINFMFTSSYVPEIINEVIKSGDKFGKSEKNKNRRAQVEFVSANPTGPLTVGHGRNAVPGLSADPGTSLPERAPRWWPRRKR